MISMLKLKISIVVACISAGIITYLYTPEVMSYLLGMLTMLIPIIIYKILYILEIEIGYRRYCIEKEKDKDGDKDE